MRRTGVATFVAIALGAASLSAHAHQDTTFAIQPDGLLSGIPEAYGPVRLIADFSTSMMCGVPPPSLAVSFGVITTVVPDCLMEVAREMSWSDVRASGSWYHEPLPGLPPYLAIKLSSHRTLLFDLETGDLLFRWQRDYLSLCSCADVESAPEWPREMCEA